MMKKFITVTTFVLFSVFSVLVLANTGKAQEPDWMKGRKYSKGDVDKIIKRVEQRSKAFVGEFDHALDHSKLNDTNREDDLNQSAKELRAATDELRGEFNKHERWWETRENVQKCLDVATNINRAMENHKFNRKTQDNWMHVRQELNTLADVYNLPALS